MSPPLTRYDDEDAVYDREVADREAEQHDDGGDDL